MRPAVIYTIGGILLLAGVLGVAFALVRNGDTHLAETQPDNIPTTGIRLTNPKTEDSTDKVPEDLKEMTTTILTASEDELPTYSSFLDDLQKTCPYYEPSGVAYRDCLYSLLKEKESTAGTILRDLENDTRIVIAEADARAGDSSQAEKDFLKSLSILSQTWRLYRNALCETDLATTWGGSNQGGMVSTCKLYETQKYITRLLGYRYDWVGSTVDQYLENGTEPKTAAFKDLTEREKMLLDEQ